MEMKIDSAIEQLDKWKVDTAKKTSDKHVIDGKIGEGGE